MGGIRNTVGPGFEDRGLTRTTPDGVILDVFERPPFVRKGGDVFRSTLLRRFYFVPNEACTRMGILENYAQWAYVDHRGRLVVGADVITPLKKTIEPEHGGHIQDALEFIRINHRLKIVPHAYETVVFWREHGRVPDMPWAYVNAAQDLRHLL